MEHLQRMTETLLNPNEGNIILQDLVTLDNFFASYKALTDAFETYRLGSYYSSKEKRLESLTESSEHYSLICLLAGVSNDGLPLVSVAAMLANRFGGGIEGIKTAAEALAVCQGDFYDLRKDIKGTYKVHSLIELDEEVNAHIRLQQYLPPMVVEPRKLRTNTDSGYLTINRDSLILGSKENQHEQNISLDVLNRLNRVGFLINSSFLDHNEEPVLQEEEIWNLYLEEKALVRELVGNNVIYFTHKVDKRGRVYSQGYHLNPQGTEFNKAALCLANKETVNGN